MNAICKKWISNRLFQQAARAVLQNITHVGHSSLKAILSRGSLPVVSLFRDKRSYDYAYGNGSEWESDAVEIPDMPLPHDDDDDEEVEDSVLDETMKNATEAFVAYLHENYRSFRYASEVYLMTTVACLGILCNGLSLVALFLDRRTSLVARRFHGAYLVAQTLFLSFMIGFLQAKNPDENLLDHLEVVNYFTTIVGVLQFVQPWLLFALASYSKDCLEHLFEIGPAPSIPFVSLVVAIVFAAVQFSMYLPPIRVYLFAAQDVEHLCNVPIARQWNLDGVYIDKSIDHTDTQYITEAADTIYLSVYCVSYSLAVYLMPYLLIALRSKGVIDLLHALQEQPRILAKFQGLACTALVTSVTCTIHLIAVTLKMVVLVFYLVQVLSSTIGKGYVFFQYVNVFANLMIVTGAGLHLLILMLYNATVKYFVLRVVFRAKSAGRQLVDRLPKWLKTMTMTTTTQNDNTTEVVDGK